jgi:hypothetical protein
MICIVLLICLAPNALCTNRKVWFGPSLKRFEHRYHKILYQNGSAEGYAVEPSREQEGNVLTEEWYEKESGLWPEVGKL